MARFCAASLQTMGLTGRSLSVVLVGARTMRALNQRYRQKDYATDVLSFAYEGETVDQLPFLGEIIIAPEVAVQQAIRNRVRPELEMRQLLVHGILHLMGYDHETDSGQMLRMQRTLARRVFFGRPPLLIGLKEK